MKIWKTEDQGYTWELDTFIIGKGSIRKTRIFGNRIYGIGTESAVFMSEELDIAPPVGISDQPTSTAQPTISPNPMQETARLTIPQDFEGPFQLDFYDLSGRPVNVQSTNAGSHSLFLDRGNLAGGVYLYRLRSANGKTSDGRMVIH